MEIFLGLRVGPFSFCCGLRLCIQLPNAEKRALLIFG